jgi:hypothetical protein
LTVLSLEAEANHRPFGATASDPMVLECPLLWITDGLVGACAMPGPAKNAKAQAVSTETINFIC